MTLKEFLNEVRGHDLKVRAYERDLATVRARAYNLSSPKLGDRVQGGEYEGLAGVVDDLRRAEGQVVQALQGLGDKKREARDILAYEADGLVFSVMYDYYINCMSWEELAPIVHVTARYAQKLNGRGLQDLEKVFQKGRKKT